LVGHDWGGALAFDWAARNPGRVRGLAFQPGPGAMMGQQLLDWCARNIAGLETEHLGFAGHHAPEDHPEVIAATVRGWADRHGLLQHPTRHASTT
jgi:haloalkane dehalogenase